MLPATRRIHLGIIFGATGWAEQGIEPSGRRHRSRVGWPSSLREGRCRLASTPPPEGVETEAEHLMVQELGCTKVQGFYFGRPLPVEEARALANQRRWNDAAAA